LQVLTVDTVCLSLLRQRQQHKNEQSESQCSHLKQAANISQGRTAALRDNDLHKCVGDKQNKSQLQLRLLLSLLC
jgi:hypothetical protein